MGRVDWYGAARVSKRPSHRTDACLRARRRTGVRRPRLETAPIMRRCSAPDIFQCRYRVMTSKNGADFVHFVTPAQAPTSQNGQSRAKVCGTRTAIETNEFHIFLNRRIPERSGFPPE